MIPKDLLKALTEKRTLVIDGKVGPEILEYCEMAFYYLKTVGNPDIEVIISSGGGQVVAGLHIYDLIRLYSGKTTGIVTVEASSMAAVILQACSVRKAAKHARILLHYIRMNEIDFGLLTDNDEEFQERKKRAEAFQTSIDKIVTERTGIQSEELKKIYKKDEHMSAVQAHSLKIVDEVI